MTAQTTSDIWAVDWRWNGNMSFNYLQTGVSPSTFHEAPGSGMLSPPPPPLLGLHYIDTSPWSMSYRQENTMQWAAAGLAVNGSVDPFSLQGLAQWQAWEDAQVLRLDAALAASPARWNIVVGHHPMARAGGGRPALWRTPLFRSSDALCFPPPSLCAVLVRGGPRLAAGAGAAERRDPVARRGGLRAHSPATLQPPRCARSDPPPLHTHTHTFSA